MSNGGPDAVRRTVGPPATGSGRSRVAIVVAGMHRSGTSALTRVLSLVGCDLPKNLMQAVPDNNEAGFWESQPIADLNDELLASAGSAWDDWRAFDAGWYASPVAAGFRERALALLHEEFGDSRLFVVKDPRICRLLPFWNGVLTTFGAECRVVSPIRNPLDVAMSLETRDGLDRSIGHLLWLRSVLDAEMSSRNLVRAHVRYETLLRDAHGIVDGLSRSLGISWPKRVSVDAQMAIDEFISPEFHHHRAGDSRLLDNPRLSRWITSAFEIFDRWSRGEVRDTDSARLGQIRSALDAATPLFGYAIAASARRIADRDRQLADRDDRIAALRHRVEERDGELAERDGELAERDGELAERDGRIAELRHGVAERDAELARLYGSRSWRMTAPLRRVRRMSRQATVVFKSRLYRIVLVMWQCLPVPIRRIVLRGPLAVPAQKLKKSLERRPRDSAPAPVRRHESGGIGSASTGYHGAQGMARDDEFVAYDARPLAVEPPARIVAFYLPQFHPIPENDTWWGKGFTEWTNVVRGRPLFEGHYQPHLPGDLGFYDLRVREAQRQQVDLARSYGIAGFCFYVYWFAGRRLLETPLDAFVEDETVDFPFCICWANESWTRTWDGLEREVLIAQRHSADDDLQFIESAMRYLRHPNYIRIDGCPLLIVYRPGLLSDPYRTAERWRRWCREHGLGEIHLAYTQSFERVDPEKIGFDSAIEFPPNLSSAPSKEHEVANLAGGFTGSIYDWSVFPETSRNYAQPDCRLFRTVNPGWDNTARRGSAATVFVNASPGGYRQWLANAIRDTRKRFPNPDHRLIFVNAWNEWAEGAHLEPDRKHGFAYLEATRSAIEQTASEATGGFLYVTHDCHPHGAQFNALAQVEGLVNTIGVPVHVAALGGGALLERFERLAPVHRLWEAGDPAAAVAELACELREAGVTRALLNTCVCGELTPVLKASGLTVVNMVHELPGVITSMGLQHAATAIAEFSDAVVFAAPQVKTGFERFAIPRGEVHLRPQGLYKVNRYRSPEARATARRELREFLDVEHDAIVVVNVGYGDERKGIDLFVDIAARVTEKMPRTHFVWVGHRYLPLEPALERQIAASGHGERIHLVGRKTDTDVFYAGADLLALTSREDPFPSVVMEAMDAGIAVVGFEDAGGFEGLLREGAGVLVPHGNLDAFARAIRRLLENRECARRIGQRGREIVAERFGWTKFMVDLVRMAGQRLHRVSVVVPNYNYRTYLDDRLTSIAAQTYPVYELIILDDASTDGSREWLEREVPVRFPQARVVVNESNSGSPFAQWLKGARVATGDILWIAEADDLCDPEFLRTVVESFDDPKTVLSYCQSRQMSEDGSIIDTDYLNYTADLSSHRWRSDHVEDSVQEITHYLAVKNTIPNVSGVLLRRELLLETMTEWLEKIRSLKVAGDWLTYILYLERGGRISYHSEPLNSHRRHDSGITLSNRNVEHLQEIIAVQRFVGERFDVPECVTEKSKTYNRAVHEHLGLGAASENGLDEIAQSAPVLR